MDSVLFPANVFIEILLMVFYRHSQIKFLLDFDPTNSFPCITSQHPWSSNVLHAPSSQGHELSFLNWVPVKPLFLERLVFLSICLVYQHMSMTCSWTSRISFLKKLQHFWTFLLFRTASQGTLATSLLHCCLEVQGNSSAALPSYYSKNQKL